MGIPFIMWVVFSWIISAILAGAFSLQFDGQLSSVNTLMQFDVFTTQSIGLFGASVKAPWPNIAWLSSLGNLLTYDYPFLKGNINMVRVIVLGSVMVGGIYGLIRDFGPLLVSMLGTLLQGVGTLANGIGGFVGSLLRRF